MKKYLGLFLTLIMTISSINIGLAQDTITDSNQSEVIINDKVEEETEDNTEVIFENIEVEELETVENIENTTEFDTNAEHEIASADSDTVENAQMKSIYDTAYRVSGGNIYFNESSGAITDCDNTVIYANIPSTINDVYVKSINRDAFSSCANLTGVTIPESVESIDEAVFNGSKKLKNINVDSNNANYSSVNGILYDKSKNTLICCPNGYSDKFETPSYVTDIGNYAFSGCNGLTDVAIGSSVKSIGEYAFENCINLSNLTIENGLSSIGGLAFCGCGSLNNVIIPNSVEHIGNAAFASCDGMESIILGNGIKSISEFTFFKCSSIKLMTIPSSVNSIGESAFMDCSDLKVLIMPDNVNSIGDCAFYGCRRLNNVIIPNGLNDIGVGVFGYCDSLKSIVIPSSVKSIDDYAFRECSGIKSITIPNSVRYISMDAFELCDNLKTVYCYKGSVADNASYYSSAELVYLSATKPVAPKFGVKGVFGGRNVTFTSDTADTKIYYSTTTSNITTKDKCVNNGSTVLFENYYGTLYAKAYYNGEWSNVSRLILKIPVVNKPTITVNGNNVNIKTTTPSCYIYYTTDGTTPSLTNGNKIAASSTNIKVPNGNVVKAIAVRSCFTNSEIASAYVGTIDPNAPIKPVKFGVKGVFGGRNVTFASDTPLAKIYYSTTTSNITTSDKCVDNGDTILFENYYGTVYAKAYYNGKWSNVSRLILKIPVVNTPTITAIGDKINIKTTTPHCYIYYTTDGTTPSLTNGKKIAASSTNITASYGKTVKAIAVRSCFTNSEIATYNKK